MRSSSALPPGFGFDPTELGALKVPHRAGTQAIEADVIDIPSGDPADDRPVPTLWIGDDGEEEEDLGGGSSDRAPGSLLVTAVCIGLALAAVAYVMDFPLS